MSFEVAGGAGHFWRPQRLGMVTYGLPALAVSPPSLCAGHGLRWVGCGSPADHRLGASEEILKKSSWQPLWWQIWQPRTHRRPYEPSRSSGEVSGVEKLVLSCTAFMARSAAI